jgi:hypothetical protein
MQQSQTPFFVPLAANEINKTTNPNKKELQTAFQFWSP